MPIELPKADKIYTHVYDNFKGVDFTNDSTNVWHRRSPDGYNMLPDESGRPFKRTGWEVVISVDDLLDFLTGKEDINILKCHYFELAGLDHIIIFTDGGVFSYVSGDLSLLTTDVDCYSSYDRAYFFEGNGKSAFYIYGNYRVWEYLYDAETDSFIFDESENFTDKEDRITIPVILIATSASDCVGTEYEAFNMLGNLAEVWYENNDMFYAYTTSTSISITANRVDFLARKVVASITQADFEADKTHYFTKSGDLFIRCTEEDAWDVAETYYEVWTPTRDTYEFVYNTSQWDLSVGGTTITNVNPADYGINILGSPNDDDLIVLKYIYGVLLPNNVVQSQLDKTIVKHSVLTQFDDELEVAGQGTAPTFGKCSLHTDTDSQPPQSRRAWIEFYNLEQPVVEGEDAISVVFPVTSIDITPFNGVSYSGTCNIVI